MLDYGNYTTLANLYPQDGDNPLSYEHLEGDWAQFYKIARYFVHKVRFEDREDFLHDLMVEMAKVKGKYEAKGKLLTEAGLMRVAGYELTDYWEKHKLPTMVVDCGNCSKAQRQKCREKDLYAQCPKAKRFISLNRLTGDGDDSDKDELIDTIADDKAIDLDAWLDAKTFLLGCPKRLYGIAYKLYIGEPLNDKDRRYLDHYREKKLKRRQKTLF